MMEKKTVLLIYPPRGIAIRSIHENLYRQLIINGYEVDKLDIDEVPVFNINNHYYYKVRNIFERVFFKNKNYILEAEKLFLNKLFYDKLTKQFKLNNTNYNFIFILKPEEFSTKFLKKISKRGDKVIGYLWDALRIHLKDDLLKSRKYFTHLYSFDKNCINENKDLKLEFLTNYFIPNDIIIPYEQRTIDAFYIGTLFQVENDKRRDVIVSKLNDLLNGNKVFKIFIPSFIHGDFSEKGVDYINEAISVDYTLELARNSKIVIDLCKEQHIGLSFRFFESLYYENKVITNNNDIVNYDFYRPENILVVDFNNLKEYNNVITEFQKIPYKKVEEEIVNQYRFDNWIKKVFKN